MNNPLKNTVGVVPISNGTKTLNSILCAIYSNKATAEDKEYYKKNYMSEYENKIGKAFFEMTQEEKENMQAYNYNNSIGNLAGYDCPKCNNRGNFMRIENGISYFSDCTCMEIRRTLKNMENSGLGNLLNTFTFDNFSTNTDWRKKVYDTAIEFTKSNKSKWFCILGCSGAGKTHICTAICKELLMQGMNLKYMMWLEEVARIKQNIISSENYYEIMNKYKNAQVLYIDDLFKSDNNAKPTASDIKIINEILNYRYYKALSDKTKTYYTIISSERTLEQLMDYDMATAGRIVEMCKPNNLIMLSGQDKNYRLYGDNTEND